MHVLELVMVCLTFNNDRSLSLWTCGIKYKAIFGAHLLNNPQYDPCEPTPTNALTMAIIGWIATTTPKHSNQVNSQILPLLPTSLPSFLFSIFLVATIIAFILYPTFFLATIIYMELEAWKGASSKLMSRKGGNKCLAIQIEFFSLLPPPFLPTIFSLSPPPSCSLFIFCYY